MSEDHPNPHDITFVVKDGKKFQAHRNVLSQASHFFEKLLSTDMKENNEGVIRLEWITESLMADILQFIYTGNVQISTQENAEKLMATADYLLLSNLKNIAGKFLEQHFTTVNCISIYYTIAEQYSCEELIAGTRKFISSNFTTVAESHDFLNLPSHEVEKWISSDGIVIDAEENVFEIIVRWIDHEKSERRVKFGELFRHVRLTTISRDILLSDVVTNDLVKENKDCLDSVTDALNWIDRSTDCDVPRPHSPRSSLKTSVIVVTGHVDMSMCFYLPATNEWYGLPKSEGRPRFIFKIVSYRGKVFVVAIDDDTDDYRLQCYDPDLNHWSIDSNLPFSPDKILVVKNHIYFIKESAFSAAALWTYNCDSNSLTPFSDKWVKKQRFCAVAVDRYIYVIGGRTTCKSLISHRTQPLSDCAKFDTEADEWQKIAPLDEVREEAFGVCKSEKIFIAGGSSKRVMLKTCEAYNILTDEWQLIASLTIPRVLGSMLLVDETLYVLGGGTELPYVCSSEFSIGHCDRIECYDREKNEWNIKEILWFGKVISDEGEELLSAIVGCPIRVFKGVLNKLKYITDRDESIHFF